MSGIINTPETAKTVATLNLADRHSRESIRVPCRTAEKGWEAVEMQEVYAMLDELQSSLATLSARSLEEWMPVGHIIVQLPSQPEPSVLYPNATWENISDSYAGAFFRTEGGLASPFGSGNQEESVPNIDGGMGVIPSTISSISTGVFERKGLSNEKIDGGGNFWKSYSFSFDASRSSPVYGRRNEVAPVNQTIRIWRKIGTISGIRSYALIDDDGIYQHSVELAEDEAGVIGHNPHIHIDTPPSKAMATRHAKASHEVLHYHRERGVWQSVEDHRGRTAYSIDGSGSRIIHRLGDTLAEGESWDAPEPTTLEA